MIAAQWAGTAAAAVHAAGALPASLIVATQGHVLAIGDFLATLAVEATIHHLDLAAGRGLADPSADGLAAVRQTLDGILGQPAPADWDDTAYALNGTGRTALTATDHACLGALAARCPADIEPAGTGDTRLHGGNRPASRARNVTRHPTLAARKPAVLLGTEARTLCRRCRA